MDYKSFQVGFVERYDPLKKFIIILNGNGRTYFISTIKVKEVDLKSITVGCIVIFSSSDTSPQPKADLCYIPKSLDDLQFILSHITNLNPMDVKNKTVFSVNSALKYFLTASTFTSEQVSNCIISMLSPSHPLYNNNIPNNLIRLLIEVIEASISSIDVKEIIQTLQNYIQTKVSLLEKNESLRLNLSDMLLFFQFEHDAKQLIDVEEWYNSGRISSNDLNEFCILRLKYLKACTTRIQYYYLNRFIIIFQKVASCEKITTFFSNELLDQVNLLLWLQGSSSLLDFNNYKSHFLLLDPTDQVIFIKKILFAAYNNEIDLTIDMLINLSRIDDDILNLSQKYMPGLIIDISSHILIESLASLKKHNRFLLKNEIIKTASKYLLDKKINFQIKDYFIPCHGRQIYDKSLINGFITKIDKEGFSKYAIKIKSPSHFNEILADVRSLKEARYDGNSKLWLVPMNMHDSVIELASKWHLILQLEKPYYKFNTWLREYGPHGKPPNIKYCQNGNPMIDKDTDLPGVWCEGYPCLKIAGSNFEKTENWADITLFDAINILNINTQNHESYYDYAGHINAINRLLDKLYCKECGYIMQVYETSANLASHNYNQFFCNNPSCRNSIVDISTIKRNDERLIYLNHCSNGCGNYVDSRESVRCSNGLVICDKCGHCCSNRQFESMRNNYLQTHSNVPQRLNQYVISKCGHNDNIQISDTGEEYRMPLYFCFRDGSQMSFQYTNIYKCEKCGTTYDIENKSVVVGNETHDDFTLYQPALRIATNGFFEEDLLF